MATAMTSRRRAAALSELLGVAKDCTTMSEWNFRCAEQEIFDLHSNNPRRYLCTLETLLLNSMHNAPGTWTYACTVGHIDRAQPEKSDTKTINKAPKGFLRCPKCKSDDVKWWGEQIRSADEGMTIFCECNKCHKRGQDKDFQP